MSTNGRPRNWRKRAVLELRAVAETAVATLVRRTQAGDPNASADVLRLLSDLDPPSAAKTAPEGQP